MIWVNEGLRNDNNNENDSHYCVYLMKVQTDFCRCKVWRSLFPQPNGSLASGRAVTESMRAFRTAGGSIDRKSSQDRKGGAAASREARKRVTTRK